MRAKPAGWINGARECPFPLSTPDTISEGNAYVLSESRHDPYYLPPITPLCPLLLPLFIPRWNQDDVYGSVCAQMERCEIAPDCEPLKALH